MTILQHLNFLICEIWSPPPALCMPARPVHAGHHEARVTRLRARPGEAIDLELMVVALCSIERRRMPAPKLLEAKDLRAAAAVQSSIL